MIILDTHAWIWWSVGSSKLTVKARRAIEQADEIGVCSISCWEVSMIVARGRLELDRDVLVWLQQAIAPPELGLIPISPQISAMAANLPKSFRGDPADKLIIATALQTKSQLVTKDQRMRSYKPVKSIWR